MSAEIIFFGKVLPERSAVGFSEAIPLNVVLADGTIAEMDLTVDHSQIIVRLRGGEQLDPPSQRNTVQAVVDALVDVVSWENGCAYLVEMVAISGPDGSGAIAVDIPAIRTTRRTPPGDSARGVLSLLLADETGELRPLRRALRDFRLAMVFADDTPFLCFRAVEALSYHFGRNPRKGIPELCRRLGIDRAWILERLEKPAGEIRHGRAAFVSGDERADGFKSAAEVINRFISLVHRRLDVLPGDEFPMLVVPNSGSTVGTATDSDSQSTD